jgi:hypothetical protein
MSRYESKDVIYDLIKMKDSINRIRSDAIKKYQIDICDTDKLSSLDIYQIITEYDSDYNINFARNGEDALSNGVAIEQKTARLPSKYTKTGKKKKKEQLASFQFHAEGDINYNRFIFAARDAKSLRIKRLYDISSKQEVKKVINILVKERELWRNKCIAAKKILKRDIITVNESVFLNKCDPLNINGCLVYKL